MTRRFTVRPRAERDIQSAYDWYESQEPGLGEESLKAARKRLDAIRQTHLVTANRGPRAISGLSI